MDTRRSLTMNHSLKMKTYLLKTTTNLSTTVKILCIPQVFSLNTSNLILDFLFNIMYSGLIIVCDTVKKNLKRLRTSSFPIIFHIVENYSTVMKSKRELSYLGFVAIVPDRQSQHRSPSSRKRVNTFNEIKTVPCAVESDLTCSRAYRRI